jgi:hypothetical protein
MILARLTWPSALVLIGAALVAPLIVQAQILLPGAAPSSSGPTAPSGKAKSRPAGPGPATRAPPKDNVMGRPLFRNGMHGAIEFERHAESRPASVSDRTEQVMRVSRLTLEGELVSKPGEICRVNVAAEDAIEAKSAGRPEGMWRFALALESCPFSFDVLDGAILVSRLPKMCVFTQADCQVDPSGLWGPQAASLGSDRMKEIEHSRARAESSLRTNFRALLARVHDGRQITAIAREQAGFSSEREQLCRDYTGEEKHGFCGARITEARAASLATRLTGPAAEEPPKKVVARPFRPTLTPASDPPPIQ